MNDLSGRCVNVVLAIEMGRGMGFLQHPMKIIANFNGRPLESDLWEPVENPMFNIELVWETEKKELRKARSANTPIRAEIVIVDANKQKDRVGFVLLSPRSANILPSSSKMETPFKWLKLIGVAPEYKSFRPEIYLSLTIRDLVVIQKESYMPEVMIEEETKAIIEEPFEKDGKLVSIQYLPNGYIQIGEGCTEKYLLTVIIQMAYSLDLLLPEVLVFNQTREKYFITFRIFGVTIKTKPFCRDLHANIPMNEKIVTRITSDYDVLQAYLALRSEIVVCFYCGRDKLGTSKLNTDDLLQNIDEEEFMSKQYIVSSEQKCFFRFPSPHGIIPTGNNNRQPYIDIETILESIEMSSANISGVPSKESVKAPSIDITVSSIFEFTTHSGTTTPPDENKSCAAVEDDSKEDLSLCINAENESKLQLSPPLQESARKDERRSPRNTDQLKSREGSPREDGDMDDDGEEEIKQERRPMSASGDQIELNTLELNEYGHARAHKKVQSLQNLTTRSEAISETCKSEESVLKNVPPLSPLACIRKVENISKQVNMYQQYCLDVILENLILKKQLKCNKIFIKFKHPKASSLTTNVAEIYDHAGEYIILENSRCKMFFVSTTEHIRKMVYAWPPKLILFDENDQPLTEELDIYTAMFLGKNRTECSYITECKALRTYEPLAKVSIMMYLQEYGLSADPKPTEYDLLPPVLDENVAIKELQDLQDWKEIQKMQFSADLKILEKQRMMTMSKEWSNKKKQLEEKLGKSVTRCEKLSQELQAAIDNIRTKKELERKESELIGFSNCSFQEIVDKNTHKYADNKKMEIIIAISKLQQENDNLKEIINDQRHEMQQTKKTALTKEQTTNLLQQLRGLEEKFEGAQKAKTYFKDQWKKAVREIHDLRSEDQKQIQEQIQTQKTELSQLSLDTFLADAGIAKYDFAQNPYTVTTRSIFGAFKWDPSNFSNDTSSALHNCKDNT